MSVEAGSGIGMGTSVATAPAISMPSFSAGIETGPSFSAPTFSTPAPEITGGSFNPSLSSEIGSMSTLSAVDISTTDHGIPSLAELSQTVPFELQKPTMDLGVSIDPITIPKPGVDLLNATKPLQPDSLPTFDRVVPGDMLSATEPLIIPSVQGNELPTTESLSKSLQETIELPVEGVSEDTFQESELISLRDMPRLYIHDLPSAQADTRVVTHLSDKPGENLPTIKDSVTDTLAQEIARTVSQKHEAIIRQFASDDAVEQLLQTYEDTYLPKTPTFVDTVPTVTVPELIQDQNTNEEEQTEAEAKPKAKLDQQIAYYPLDEETEEEKRRKKMKQDPELVTDVAQAVRLQRALEAVGVPTVEAQQQALGVLHTVREQRTQHVSTTTQEQTELERGVQPQTATEQQTLPEEKVLTKEQVLVLEDEEVEAEEKDRETKKVTEKESRKIVFEEDPIADQNRVDLAVEATIKALEENQPTPGERITGASIAAHMPDAPQPVPVKSDLLLQMFDGIEFPDGSYDEVVERIAKTGVIYSADHAEKAITDAIANAPAVRVNERVVTRKVTDKDVKRVLNGKINSIVRDLFS